MFRLGLFSGNSSSHTDCVALINRSEFCTILNCLSTSITHLHNHNIFVALVSLNSIPASHNQLKSLTFNQLHTICFPSLLLVLALIDLAFVLWACHSHPVTMWSAVVLAVLSLFHLALSVSFVFLARAYQRILSSLESSICKLVFLRKVCFAFTQKFRWTAVF